MSTTAPAPAATVTTPSDREIRVEREFAVSRERLFAVLTDPELVPEWWGPRGTATIVDRMDPRRGGTYRFLAGDCDGGEMTGFRGAYREVVAPERIVQTFEWEGMPGHVSVETATLEDLGADRARLVSVSVFHTAEERDGMLASGMEGGMNETYARLDELLERPEHEVRRTPPGRYVDLYLLPVPERRIDAYREQALAFGAVAREHGALAYREFRGDDLAEGFDAAEGDLLTAAVVEFASREHRDAVMAAVLADPRVEELMRGDADARMELMRYGGFTTLLDA